MTLIIILIAVALVFDFLNGLHDAANSIATIVSTRVLAPRYAVAWAAFRIHASISTFLLINKQSISIKQSLSYFKSKISTNSNPRSCK